MNRIKTLRRIGALIRLYRLKRKMTQRELAIKCRQHATYISSIEAGKQNVTIETLCIIADALQVSLEQLIFPTETA